MRIAVIVKYLECTTLLLFLLRMIGPERVEERGMGTFAACQRLGAAPVGSLEGWRLLARACRHLLRVAEDDGDVRLPVVQQLDTEIMAYSDRAAARIAARKGGDDGGTQEG